MAATDLSMPIQYLRGCGPWRAALFAKLGVLTLEHLFSFLPHRYEDRTVCRTIREAGSVAGEETSILASVVTSSLITTSRVRMKIVDVVFSDDTGTLHAKWFNQPYLKRTFVPGQRVMLYGRVSIPSYDGYTLTHPKSQLLGAPLTHPKNSSLGALEMENPQYELIDEGNDMLHVGRIVPIYHETKGLTSRHIRTLTMYALTHYPIPEHLPLGLLSKYQLMPLGDAVSHVHFPPDGSDLTLWHAGKSQAHRRLAFDELFLMQLGLAVQKQGREASVGIAFDKKDHPDSLSSRLQALIPFPLTEAQKRVFAEIKENMASSQPMYRLIQGDVGAGKTILAFMASVIAIDHGCQAALMVPTEILAWQHFMSLQPYLLKLGRCAVLLTSDLSKKERDRVIAQIQKGEADLVIGTHALIQGEVQFNRLGLVVVDEQHKFGVLQRAKLTHLGHRPDVLVMTATPIPRTLGMTLYGDLHLSTLDGLPPGRLPVKTQLYYSRYREEAYRRVEAELICGRQGYVVCPLIETSEKTDLKAAGDVAAWLQRNVLPHRRIGLIHGKMRKAEKERMMSTFKEGGIDLLVATTVVEVGMDVPNATVMVIEHAERLGLATLHQLRGRVGRGTASSLCLMIAYYPISPEGHQRLQMMQKTHDGFKIAEADLEIRGPGEFFGTRQSGIPQLRVANIIRDVALLEEARREAFRWIAQDPTLAQAGHREIRASVERKWQGKMEWLTSG